MYSMSGRMELYMDTRSTLWDCGVDWSIIGFVGEKWLYYHSVFRYNKRYHC